jgi:hypothetical protein
MIQPWLNRARTAAKFGAIAILACAASGCVSNAGWEYRPNPAEPAGVSVPLAVAVPHFQDDRPEQNSTHFFLCLIPAVPYCKASYHRPDTANGFHTVNSYNFRPSEDLAEAAASELRQTGMFREVYVTDRSQDPSAQLVLRGTIMNTDWDGTRYTYGLAGDGQVLWLLGLPLGTVDDHLSVGLDLVEERSGTVLWHYDLSREYQKTEGLYYNYGEDFGYAKMFREGMKDAMASLENYVRSQPAGFWAQMQPPE